MTTTGHDNGLRIALISLHGLIRSNDAELGRDADTGGQVKYVLELAAELGRHSEVSQVELITRQIIDPKVGTDYAQLEEPIGENAKIVRIPFGPKRYLRKEALWPHMESFVDQALVHFRRTGLPHVIHGHYADAGYGGAQLARLLRIPFVFTGHSLGRIKKQRLLDQEAQEKELEQTYRFTTRSEAEEIAIETASLIVTSTSQEIEQQYEVYEAYMPERMEVIPPGVDLSRFRPAASDEPRPAIADALVPFLKEPDKPMILTMARPDDRKNLETLVRVYGESPELQELANLVMIMGTRDDLRSLAAGQRRVIQNVLTLIDVYNLYGKVAYPKTHVPDDVPELYRLATQGHGVFINPALTEPFGLTLLEAAGTGLPIVATNDGGPRDIIANCKNGLLVDPVDQDAIEKALLRMLTEPDLWETWSKNGMQGAREHYSWKRHVERYLRDVKELVSVAAEPVLAEGRRNRRMQQFDRLIITDLDNTLTGDDQALAEFIQLLNEQGDHVGFGIATGRSFEDTRAMIEKLGLPTPDLLSTSVGTELRYGDEWTPDRSWQQQISFQWKPGSVRDVLDEVDGLFLQSDQEQSAYKISYKIDPKIAPKAGMIRRMLREAGLRVKVVLSLEIYLDIIPVRGGDELAIRHFLYKWGFQPEQVLVVGDSGNDEGMLKGRTLGVVVGNYSPELEKLRKLPRIYFAEAAHARGIIEGINYYNFLDHITIPNDRTEPANAPE